MQEISKISESELQVMKLLWITSPLTSDEIIRGLSLKHNWSGQTIKTFITRLVNKGMIGYEKKGRAYNYSPLYSKDEYVKLENRVFLRKVYDGALSLLLTNFLEEKDLSLEQIEELECILKDKKNHKSSKS